MGRRSPISLGLPAVATAAVALSVVAVAEFAVSPTPAHVTDPRALLSGTVRTESGGPLPGAQVWLGEELVTTNREGRFSIEHGTPAVVTASAQGHLGRSIAVEPGVPIEVRLTKDPANTVSLRFGGDVMFGRRYETGGPGQPPILKRGASANEISDVLSGVAPVLKDSDLTVVNLETALIPGPWDGEGTRPAGLHPTKDLVITSPTASARALADAGVKVVSLSNNHTFDGLGTGLKSTLDALDAAGVSHYGAGATIAQAWAPAVATVRGHRVAFVGCTTVDGRHSGTPYVADAKQGGAAECNPALLTAAVQRARRTAPLVVVSIHGGVEYRRSQSAEVRALAAAAQKAGAQLVVGSHPHVVGGLVRTGQSVFAESLGNLSFDQDLWATLPSYLLRVDARFPAGAKPATLVAVDTDPVLIDHYRPRAAVGTIAESVSRVASGWVEGGAVLQRDSAEIRFDRAQPGRVARVPLAKNELQRISPGWWLPPAPDLAGQVRVGSDLLFGTGSFEPTTVGGVDGAVPGWSPGKYASVTREAACTPGGRGALLVRTPLSAETAVLSPDHRTPVSQGQLLTLVANVRQASEGSHLEVHWYDDMAGNSTSVKTMELPTGAWASGSCQRVRLDMNVPRKAVAAQVFVVLHAPEGGQTIRRLAVDDIALVDWAPKGRSGRRYDIVDGLRSGTVTFRSDRSDPVEPSPLVR